VDLKVFITSFENRTFIDAWLDAFHDNFERFSQFYLDK